MKIVALILLLASFGMAFWGCPTRKYIPDPTPPKPEVMDVMNAYDDLLSQDSSAPHAGPKVEFRRMLAQN